MSSRSSCPLLSLGIECPFFAPEAEDGSHTSLLAALEGMCRAATDVRIHSLGADPCPIKHLV